MDLRNIALNANENFANLVTIGTGGRVENGKGEVFNFETGIFTPDLQDNFGNSATGGIREGRYSKVGRKVTVWIRLENVVTTDMTSTGNLRVVNLPFTVANIGSNFASQGAVHIGGVTTTANYITAYGEPNTTQARFLLSTSGAGGALLLVSALNSGSNRLWFSIEYWVS